MSRKESEELDKLLLVFVHGFRGSSTSFKDFPNRLQTILTNTIKADVEVDVYPSYKTAGELRIAVRDFSNWLCDKVKVIKDEIDRFETKANIMIVLLGHSMGGIVSAETILRFQEEEHKDKLLGANMIGLLTYDTPFYSINRNFIAEKAWSGVDHMNRGIGDLWNAGAAICTAVTATKTMQRMSHLGAEAGKKWGIVAGIVSVTALGAAAFATRQKISSNITNAYQELTFVSDLTDIHGLNERVNKLLQVSDVSFRCYYVKLSHGNTSENATPRTFINPPPPETAEYFIPVPSPAIDEVRAHINMFNPNKTDYYYEMGTNSIFLISEMVSKFQREHSPFLITF